MTTTTHIGVKPALVRSPLALVAAGFAALSVLLVPPTLALGWDEIVYVSQWPSFGPTAPFSAPRSRGVPLLVAPVAAVTDSVAALRCWLAAAAGLALYLGYRPWLAFFPERRAVVPVAAAAYGTLWFALFYGGSAMPNHYVAMAAVGAVGAFARGRWPAVAAAVTVAGLMRAADAVWLALPLLLWPAAAGLAARVAHPRPRVRLSAPAMRRPRVAGLPAPLRSRCAAAPTDQQANDRGRAEADPHPADPAARPPTHEAEATADPRPDTVSRRSRGLAARVRAGRGGAWSRRRRATTDTRADAGSVRAATAPDSTDDTPPALDGAWRPAAARPVAASARARGLFLAVVGGLVAGVGPWVVEAQARFGGVWERLREASEIQGGAGLTFSLPAHAAALDGPLLCRPCEGDPVVWPLLAWWLVLPPLTAAGLYAHRRLPALWLAVVTAGSLSFTYLFLIDYAATRFLLPAYALLAIPVVVGARAVAARLPWRTATVGVLVLAHLTPQFAALRAHAGVQRQARADFTRVAAVLRGQGVGPPCVLGGGQAIPVAHVLGCRTADRGETPGALVLRNEEPPRQARDWTVVEVPDTYNSGWRVAVPAVASGSPAGAGRRRGVGRPGAEGGQATRRRGRDGGGAPGQPGRQVAHPPADQRGRIVVPE